MSPHRQRTGGRRHLQRGALYLPRGCPQTNTNSFPTRRGRRPTSLRSFRSGSARFRLQREPTPWWYPEMARKQQALPLPTPVRRFGGTGVGRETPGELHGRQGLNASSYRSPRHIRLRVRLGSLRRRLNGLRERSCSRRELANRGTTVIRIDACDRQLLPPAVSTPSTSEGRVQLCKVGAR